MEKKQRKARVGLSDIIPDDTRRSEMLSRMYKGDPILGDGGIFTELLQAFVNAALEGEMDSHLSQTRSPEEKNRRNGHNKKVVRSTAGPMEIKTPRDRNGTHEPELVKAWERELSSGIDEIILSLYARGHSVEDVRAQVRRIYGVELSVGTISAITDRVWDEILTWQQRPLESCYAIIYLDAIHYKVRQDGQVLTKAIYTVYGVGIGGQREVLSLHLNESEGARNWGLVLEDLRRRGVEEVLFFCVDGLKGFKEVVEAVYPKSQLQRCIVHMVRTSTRFVSEKDRKVLCSDLRKIYTAANREQARTALEVFGRKWDGRYQEIRPKWEEHWEELMAFMDYGEQVHRMIYTTNPVEALHRVMRKVTKAKGAWSNDKGLLKQLYLALKYNEKSYRRNAFNWLPVQRELLDRFGDRIKPYVEG